MLHRKFDMSNPKENAYKYIFVLQRTSKWLFILWPLSGPSHVILPVHQEHYNFVCRWGNHCLSGLSCFLRNGTVKPVMKDHCHERPPVLTDHAFLAERPTFQYNWTCQQKDHLSWQTTFLWQMGWSFKTGSSVQWYIWPLKRDLT